jgi:hypothetical protein
VRTLLEGDRLLPESYPQDPIAPRNPAREIDHLNQCTQLFPRSSRTRPYAKLAGCGKLSTTKEALEGPMVREIELLAVSLVFVFLGACVFGVIH